MIFLIIQHNKHTQKTLSVSRNGTSVNLDVAKQSYRVVLTQSAEGYAY